MAISKRDVKVVDGAIVASNNHNPVVLGQACGIANASGAAGVTVTTAVLFTEALPSTYSVLVQPGQGVGWYISNKVTKGFSVNLVPFAAGVSVAAGSFDVTFIAA